MFEICIKNTFRQKFFKLSHKTREYLLIISLLNMHAQIQHKYIWLRTVQPTLVN